MRPAGFAVAATIRACGAGGEWRKGLQVLRRSQEISRSKPDPCSLSAAIEICCHAGELVSGSFSVGGIDCTTSDSEDHVVAGRIHIFSSRVERGVPLTYLPTW